MTTAHDNQLLGAYVLGALDPDERRQIEDHLGECAPCRDDLADLRGVRDMIGELPPEALLHGPPDADLALQRTLRQVRAESATQRRWAVGAAAAAAALVVGGAMAVGAVLGRASEPDLQAQPPGPAPSVSALPGGTRVGTVTDPATAVRLTASVVPASGWVRVNAAVNGVPQGENCRLVVVHRDGHRETAGGWIVSEQGARDGTNLDGSAAVAIDDLRAIEVENTSGRRLVSLRL